jgi:hypothetical protein
MAGAVAPIFLIPSPKLGPITDVAPEILNASHNDWFGLSREVLERKRAAAEKGAWKPEPMTDISDEHSFIRPFGAQFCPALQELNSLGVVVKWPANAILERKAPRVWEIRSSEPHAFYKFHTMSSFPAGGLAEAISVSLGWIVSTPPGVSVLIKNIPNNHSSAKAGISFAEGTVRTDQAAIPMQVHAYLSPDAPKQIEIKRGEPMALLMPYRREKFEIHVMNDADSVELAAKYSEIDQETFANSPGRYKALFIEDTNPSPLYPKLLERTPEPPAKKEGA